MFWASPWLAATELCPSSPVAARHRAEDADPKTVFNLAAAHKVSFRMSTSGNWWVLVHCDSDKYALSPVALILGFRSRAGVDTNDAGRCVPCVPRSTYTSITGTCKLVHMRSKEPFF